MPIQITTTISLADVNRQLHEFEKQYKMSSATFAGDPSLDRVIPEDDAMDWNFLIEQKQVLEGSEKCADSGCFAPFESTVTTQDSRNIYEKIAA